jgi:hypothetical protein
MPFDRNNPESMRVAISVGVGTTVALSKHVPTPFLGSAELIFSAERAPHFFNPKAKWREILPGFSTVHVLPCGHEGMFRDGRHQLTRVLNFVLEGIVNSGDLRE